MSIELQPLGVKCGLACTYCYQQEQRASNPGDEGYDLEVMKAAALAEGVGHKDGRGNITGWTLFGGEGLLTPINDVEKLLEWSASLGAPVGVQTHGGTITDRHIELFKKYRVSVGFSIDGPGELNNARQAKDPRATLATTEKSIQNLHRLLDEKISVSLIVTLTRINAGSSIQLTTLISWLLGLRDRGLRYVNFHTLEPHGDDLSMTQEQQIVVMRKLRRALTGFERVSPFHDMRDSLMQRDGSNCIWNFCDPYTTPAVRGVNGQGVRSNCGRTNKDGVAYEKGATTGHERQLALYLTPQADGGCAECRFFLPCGGGNCPGEGIDGDWRNRTVHCETIKALMGDIEHELVRDGLEPISTSLRRASAEGARLAQWAGLPVAGNIDHGDKPHGDAPHGDKEHGDHTDAPATV